MDMTVLNKDLDPILVIDSYESLIWTDRYAECGDFELYNTIDELLLSTMKRDFYLLNPESEHVMCIETIRITSDIEDGSRMIIEGYSLEKILSRRVIWGNKKVSGTPQEVIKELLNDCIINPTNANRQIKNFVFSESSDPSITGLESFEAEYTGDNLYNIVTKICKENKIGFKITLDMDSKTFIFKLYAGVNRSYNQVENSYVIFSPSFDNLITANYMETSSALKTVALVAGKGEGESRTLYEVDTGGLTGIERRELFVDASNLSTYDEAPMEQRGKEELSECADISSFEGQAETRIMFKYGQDFFTGDIVQFADGYGHEAPARIVEMITSDGVDGLSVYPTFETIQKEGE